MRGKPVQEGPIRWMSSRAKFETECPLSATTPGRRATWSGAAELQSSSLGVAWSSLGARLLRVPWVALKGVASVEWDRRFAEPSLGKCVSRERNLGCLRLRHNRFRPRLDRDLYLSPWF